MGEAFLCAYYESMLKQDGSINVVVEVDAEVVGFCVGGLEASVSFRSLFRTHWRDLAPPLLKKFITSPTVAVSMLRRAEGLSSAAGDQARFRVCELSSIASDQRGGGAVLLDAFLKAASASYDVVRLSTRKYHNERVVSFYITNGFEITDEFRRADYEMLRLERFF